MPNLLSVHQVEADDKDRSPSSVVSTGKQHSGSSRFTCKLCVLVSTQERKLNLTYTAKPGSRVSCLTLTAFASFGKGIQFSIAPPPHVEAEQYIIIFQLSSWIQHRGTHWWAAPLRSNPKLRMIWYTCPILANLTYISPNPMQSAIMYVGVDVLSSQAYP